MHILEARKSKYGIKNVGNTLRESIEECQKLAKDKKLMDYTIKKYNTISGEYEPVEEYRFSKKSGKAVRINHPMFIAELCLLSEVSPEIRDYFPNSGRVYFCFQTAEDANQFYKDIKYYPRCKIISTHRAMLQICVEMVDKDEFRTK